MSTSLQLDELTLDVQRKDIKHLYLRVQPATGRVRISAPTWMSLDTIRRFVLSKLGWIKHHQQKQRAYRPQNPHIKEPAHVVKHHRQLLDAAVPPLIEKWEPRLNVKVKSFSIRRMKTRWGSCTPTANTIRLNTALAKMPSECLEYVVVHEMVHLLEPSHNARFRALMDLCLPNWRKTKATLNSPETIQPNERSA